jgi:hypothetical protein
MSKDSTRLRFFKRPKILAQCETSLMCHFSWKVLAGLAETHLTCNTVSAFAFALHHVLTFPPTDVATEDAP